MFCPNPICVTEFNIQNVFRYCDCVDGHFLVAPHPDFDNLIIASGDSGHGMKYERALYMQGLSVHENFV